MSNPLVIRNVMEAGVFKVVNQIAEDDLASESPQYLTTDECRMDVACFVLNRIPQRYVSSARGQAHIEQEIERDQQLFVDMVTLAHEGYKRVSSVKRSFYGEQSHRQPGSGPHFLFPAIKGRLFNGVTFELISEVKVDLLLDGELVPMIDSRWQNPYEIDPQTAGTFTFWPAPVQADKENQTKSFEFELRINDDRYEAFRHFVTISKVGTTDISGGLAAAGEHRVPDLYLVPVS